MYAHVIDKTIREVLDGDLSEDAICYALTETRFHALSDTYNEDIPHELSAYRLELAEEASWWWNEEGDAFKAVEALRQCWKA